MRRTIGRLAVVAAVGWGASAALATSYTWDVNGATAGTGGTGNWDTTSSFWTPDGSTYTTWPTTGTNTAIFGGTAGTVTLAVPVYVNTMTFNVSGYIFSNSGTGTLTLNGSSPTINTNGYNVAFNMGANTFNLSGGTNIYKTGAGTLTFANDQNGSLPTNVVWNVSGGTLNTSTGLYSSALAMNSGRPLGNATGNVLTLNAASLVFTASGGNGFAASRTINITNLGGAISDGGFAPGEGGGGSTISPTINIAAGAGLNIATSDVMEFDAGVIAGAGGVTAIGNGSSGNAELLSSTNSYTGVTTINNTTLTISTIAIGGSNSSIGASTNAASNLIINGSAGTANALGAGASLVFTGTGTNTTDRGLTLEGTTQINFNVSNSGASLTFGGQIVNNGGGRVYKFGAGTLAFTDTNFTNTLTTVSGYLNVAAGTLQLGATGQIDNVNSDIRIGGPLTTTGNNPTFNVVGGTVNIANTNTGGLDLGNGVPSAAGAQTITANLTAGTVNTYNVYTDEGCNGNIAAVLNMSGGAVINNAGVFEANQTAGTGNTFVMNLSGSGTLLNSSSGVASLSYTSGTGLVNQSGGTAQFGTLYIAGGAGTTAVANGTYNLGNGTVGSGTLIASSIGLGSSNASSTAVLNLNGGTLQASASSSAFISGITSVKVLAGGAIINTQSNNDTILQPLLNGTGGADGGLTKLGSGTLTLTGNNTYTGTTNISAGALVASTSGNGIGAATANLIVSGLLNLNGNNITANALTSVGGTGVTTANSSAGDTLDFQIGSGTINTLTVSSATMTGMTGIELNSTGSSSLSVGSTYTLVSSSGGGLTGNVAFAGGQNLTVPATSVIQNVGGTNYRLTLADTGSAITVTASAAPSHVVNIMPLGSSITEGDSAQNPYNGGGYRSQLYENLVNDGRFTPVFVGSNTGNGADNPTGPALIDAVGQSNNEGHSGYTTSQVLANLNTGGNWLSTGNGVNPNYVTLNIGGNDFVANPTDTTAIGRLSQIVDDVSALRPNATIIVSSILYRGDGGGAAGTGITTLYDPYIPQLVYQHILAGEHVSYVDMYSLITPGNSLALIGPDLVHPVQAGYDLMANAWYTALTTGQAFYTGNAGSTWNATSGSTTSWAQDFGRTTDAGVVPGANTDVYFNGVGGSTTLGTNFSVRSVNFTAAATAPVTIGGTSTLTIGAGGITVQAGTGAHTISAPVVLGAAQEWGNVSTSRFNVTGAVSGSGALTIVGTGVIALSGNNTYSGTTSVQGGTLVAANSTGSATGTGALNISSGAKLAGLGSISGPLDIAGTITGGNADGTFGLLSANSETWEGKGEFLASFSADGTLHDSLEMNTLTLSSSDTSTTPFIIAITSPGDPTLSSPAPLILATDADNSSANPFSTANFLLDSSDFQMQITNLQPTPGYAFKLGTQPDGNGYDLVLNQVSTAVPEPVSLGIATAASALLLGRRSRRRSNLN